MEVFIVYYRLLFVMKDGEMQNEELTVVDKMRRIDGVVHEAKFG